MDFSLGYLTRLVDEDKFKLGSRSIDARHLSDDHIAVHNYISSHYRQYKQCPSREAVLKAFPGFEFGNYKEPLEFFIEALQDQYDKRVLDEGLQEVAEIYIKDTKGAKVLLRELLQELDKSSKSHQDLDAANSALERIAWYEDRKANPGVYGIPSGWPTLDGQTLGWQPGEFAVLVGEKWMGKSWIMIWLAYKAALDGEKVLFITKEMTQEQVQRRFDAVWASVRFEGLRKGELTDIEEERFKEKLKELAESNIFFRVARQGVYTIDDIQMKAVETDATIIFGDSIYLFNPSGKAQNNGEPARRMAVSQRCKEVAQELQVPFIVSVQAGRSKTKKPQEPDIDNIEWSNAFSQDADTVFYLERTPLDREVDRAHMWLLKCRDGNLADFYIGQDFNTMIFNERADSTRPTTQVFEDDEVIEFGG